MAIAPDDTALVFRDRANVEAHQSGDPDAFALIVADHYRSLLAQAQRRMGTHSEAEDVVQEVFERAFRSIGRFGGDYRLGPWLSLITSNVCANHGARRIAQRRLPERVSALAVMAPDTADLASDQAVLAVVQSAISSLPDSQRQTFVLHEIGGLTYPQVADQLGISEENARTRVHRAKSTLRRRLDGMSGLLGGFALVPSHDPWSGSPRPRLIRHRSGTDLTHRPLPQSANSVHSSGLSSAFEPGSRWAWPGVQQAASQLATTVTSSGIGQAAVATAPAARGSVVMGLMTGIAAAATAAMSVHGGGGLAAAASATATKQPPALLTATTDTPPAPATAAATTSSSSTTVSPTVLQSVVPSANAPVASSAAAGSTSWITSAGSAPLVGPSTGPSSSTTSSGSPSTGTTAASAPSAAVVESTSCQFLASFPDSAPGGITTTDPFDATEASALATPTVLLSSTSDSQAFGTNAVLTSASGDVSTAVHLLVGFCLPPTSGVLIVNVSTPDGTEIQLRGTMVSSSGGPSDSVALFRGTVQIVNSPTGATSLPWGTTASFVAQLVTEQPQNTAQLWIAFVATTPASSTSTTDPSDQAAGTPVSPPAQAAAPAAVGTTDGTESSAAAPTETSSPDTDPEATSSAVGSAPS